MKRAMAHRLMKGGQGLALILLLFVSSVSAQGWEVTFGGNLEDQGVVLTSTIDGGFLAIGYSESFGSDNDFDIYLIRTDIDGTLVWETTYDEGYIERANDILSLPNGNFLLVGNINDVDGTAAGTPSQVYLMEVDFRGRMVWSRRYLNEGLAQSGSKISTTSDGGYIISGQTQVEGGEPNILLIKLNAEANEEWREVYGTPYSDEGIAVTEVENGFSIVANVGNGGTFNDKDVAIYRIGSANEVVSERFYRGDNEDNVSANDALRTQDNHLVVVGSSANFRKALIMKSDLNGDTLWTREIEVNTLGENEFNAVTELANGDFIATGYTIQEVEGMPANPGLLLVKLTPDGDVVWERVLGTQEFEDWRFGEDIVEASDENLVLVGTRSQSSIFINDVSIIKLDSEGNYFTNLIQGTVHWSVDGCNPLEDGDQGLQDWLVQVEGENNTFIGSTNSEGFYSIPVGEGEFTVTLLPRNDAWDVCSPSTFPVTFTTRYDTLTFNFPVRTAAEACPYLSVDTSTEPLVSCTQAEYLVEYCNDGSATGDAAFVEIVLDEDLTFLNASVPFTQVAADTVIVELGDLDPLDCGDFTITVDVSCDVQNLQAAVFTANIYPNDPCEIDPDWDGSSIEVTGRCEDNIIYFTARNVGTEITSTRQSFVIVEDQVLFLEGADDTGIDILDPGQSVDFPEEGIPANEMGSTYRAVVQQVEGHPGSNFPTVAVEGCTIEGEDNFTTGQVTQFPENDQDASVDIDVQEIIVSTFEEATLLIGHPRGYQDSVIERNTDIEYTILFANIGSDTLDRLVIRDTLSQALDFSTFAVGPASHPYVHEMNSSGVLKITFDDLTLLPADGNDSDADSRGFIKFTLSQKPDLPIGTVIENRAAVYFDYVAPELSNSVRHVVNCENFISGSCLAVDLDEGPPESDGISIRVQPNPFQISTTLVVEGCECSDLEVAVFDAAGRELRREQFIGTMHTLHRNGLPSGIYFLEVTSEGRIVQTGKLLVQ
ncbi:MAG: T9SS type A sorting domain-containing protein [Bacteroidota bacterium]